MKTLLLSLSLAALAAACTNKEEAPAPEPGGSSAPKAQTVAVPSSVHEVRCGCKIDSVGHCGNYVDVDGSWLVIGNPDDHGLDKMEWCGATDTVKAKLAGNRTDDTITLSELEVQ